jgi:3-hydroxyisobutyryl-CoA hydrolase
MLTLRSIREGAGKSLATCLRTEYRVVCHVVDGPSDFQEGVQALLIEKHGKPTWLYPTLSQVGGRAPPYTHTP